MVRDMKVEPEEFTQWFRRYLKASGGVNGVAERTRIPAQTIYGLRAGSWPTEGTLTKLGVTLEVPKA